MSEASFAARVPLNLVRGCLVAPASPDVSRASLDRLRQDLLDRVRATGARRVLLDLSAVPLMDTEDFESISRLVAAAALMGARTVVAGLRPGVVSALVELGVDGAGLETALDLDHGFALLETEAPAADDADDDGTTESA